MSRASTLSGFTTAIGQPTNLNVGVITAVTVSSANVLFDDNLTTKQLTAIGLGVTNLNVSGVSTLSALNVSGVSTFSELNVSGVSTLSALNVSGVSTLSELNVSGVSTFSELNVSGVSTFSDVSIADKIVHTGDTDTALRFPTVDTITVETDGTERLRITSDGNVGIGSTLAAVSVDISEKNDAVALPVGTTAQRPSTAYGGYIRWNSTSSALEVYNGTNWVEIISDYFPTGSTTLG
jgi:hypothetical protein